MHQFEHKRVNVNIKWGSPLTIAALKELKEEKCGDTCSIR